MATREMVVTPKLLDAAETLVAAAKAFHDFYRDGSRRFIDEDVNQLAFVHSVFEKFEIEAGIAGEKLERDYAIGVLAAAANWNPANR